MNLDRFFKIIRERFDLTNKYIIRVFNKIFTPMDLFKILNFKFEKAKYFIFKDEKLKYFYHSYNNHRLTERSIEIPIIRYYLKKTGIRNCLEIGNVTNHYYSYFQDLFDSKVVVDKYEKGCGIIKKDIRDYLPSNKFNFIFSISTFEHMDSDRGRNPEYIKGKSKYNTYATDNIVHVCNNMLNSGGTFIIASPLGYTHEWDQTLFSSDINDKNVINIKSIKIYYYRKINYIEWMETNKTDGKNAKYNYPLPGVNVLSIVEIIK